MPMVLSPVMNRIFLIGGLGVIAIALISGFFLSRLDSDTTSSATQSSSSVTRAPTRALSPTATVVPQISFQDLLTMGGDHKCTWSGSTNGQTMDGVVYLSGRKVHSEAHTTVPTLGAMTAYAVGDGTTMTIWTSIAPAQKTTMPYAQMDAPSTSGKQAFNAFAQKYAYHCTGWKVDPKVFVIPQ